MLHTHLAENDEDIAYPLEKFGCRPGQCAQDLGWVGPDVWHAHCVKLDQSEMYLFAGTRTACPSTCRLGSGIAPVRYAAAGVRVGGPGSGRIGKQRRGHPDCGGASGDAVERGPRGADAMSAREARKSRPGAARGYSGTPPVPAYFQWAHARTSRSGIQRYRSCGKLDPELFCWRAPQRLCDLLVEGRVVVRDGAARTIIHCRHEQNHRARAIRDGIKQMFFGILGACFLARWVCPPSPNPLRPRRQSAARGWRGAAGRLFPKA